MSVVYSAHQNRNYEYSNSEKSPSHANFGRIITRHRILSSPQSRILQTAQRGYIDRLGDVLNVPRYDATACRFDEFNEIQRYGTRR